MTAIVTHHHSRAETREKVMGPGPTFHYARFELSCQGYGPVEPFTATPPADTLYWITDASQIMAHQHVYIVRCSDGSLYSGVAADSRTAAEVMNSGGAPAYVKPRLPVFLVHTEEWMNETDARKRLEEVRKLDRRGKEQMISVSNMHVMESWK